MGILTSSAFADQGKSDGLIRQPAPHTPPDRGHAKPGFEVKPRVVLPHAPEGESTAAFYGPHGHEMRVTLVDGEYVFPPDMDKAARKEMTRILVAAGFVDESTIVKKAKPTAPELRRFAHPDNTPDSPVEGTIKMVFKRQGKKEKQEFQLDIFGTITTDDPAVIQRLEKWKWPEVTVQPGTDEEPDDDPTDADDDTGLGGATLGSGEDEDE